MKKAVCINRLTLYAFGEMLWWLVGLSTYFAKLIISESIIEKPYMYRQRHD